MAVRVAAAGGSTEARVVTVNGKLFGAYVCGTCEAHREFMTGRNLRGEERTCMQCGTVFYVRPYVLSIGGGVYCSVPCRTLNCPPPPGWGRVPKHKSKDSTEAKKIRDSPAYKAWRTAVFTRDDFTCQGCGAHGGKLNADHIKPFAYFPDLRLEVDNGRTLCLPCHRGTDTFGWKAFNAVRDRKVVST